MFKRAPAPALITSDGIVISVVYVTASPTFTGVIGGYSTVSQDTASTDSLETSTNTAQPQTTATTTSQVQLTRSTSSQSAIRTSNTLLTSAATYAASTVISSSSVASYGSTTAALGSSSTDSSSSSATSSADGMSVGGKIALAVGILCGIGVLAAIILLCFARKRKQLKQQEEATTEKEGSGYGMTAGDSSGPVNAPRLSLRPVSSLVPEFMGGPKQRSRNSQGNMLGPISEASKARNMSPPQTADQLVSPLMDRSRTTDNPFKDPENPFADPEKGAAPVSAGVMSPVSPVSQNSYPSPASAHGPVPVSLVAGQPPNTQRSSGPTAESFPIPQAQPHGQLPPASAAAQIQKSSPVPSSITVPAVTYAELPGAPSPVVAQGPGPEMPQANVYRILMDFRPTMDDELELRAGQLVRLLHEYDDGWALCIRLDRSQQGVVPRTCLAAKPSRPRPGPPPMAPGSRPMTPQGRPRGPTGQQGQQGPPGFGSPHGGPGSASAPMRAQSPSTIPSNTGAFNQPPRPLSPGPRPQPPSQSQPRSMSPGPYGAGGPKPMAQQQQRRRSNSASAASVRNKRNSPPGPSKLGPGTPPPARSTSPGLAM